MKNIAISIAIPKIELYKQKNNIMKITLFSFCYVFIGLLFLTACKKTETADPPSTTTNTIPTIGGNWNLISYNPSAILPNTNTYNPGDIVWNFNVNSKILTISNKNYYKNTPHYFSTLMFSFLRAPKS